MRWWRISDLNFLVTYHTVPLRSVVQVEEMCVKGTMGVARAPDRVAQKLLDALVENFRSEFSRHVPHGTVAQRGAGGRNVCEGNDGRGARAGPRRAKAARCAGGEL